MLKPLGRHFGHDRFEQFLRQFDTFVFLVLRSFVFDADVAAVAGVIHDLHQALIIEFTISFDLDVIKIYEDYDKTERIAYGAEMPDPGDAGPGITP